MSCPVARSAQRASASPFVIFGAQCFSYAQADAAIEARAEALAREGVARGARVKAQRFNEPWLAWTFFACLRLEATFIPINARLTPFEVERLPFETHAPGDEPTLAGMFTSGTTGTPKLIELPRSAFEANAEMSAQVLGGAAAHRWLGTLPLFHIGGLAMLYRCAVYGASVQLEAGFDVQRVSQALDGPCTHASLVPTMLDRLTEVRAGRPFRGVHAVLIGGAPMSSVQLQRARAMQLPVLQTYGLTEACSQVTTERLDEADGQTAGRPLPGVEVRIVDGEVQVKAPTVAKGLGPWLHTKDLGALDERGRLRIFARRSDLIISGGENVYPAEVEAVLRSCPGVDDVAVIGRDDQRWGQVPIAAVVGSVSEDELLAFARQRLAGFKLPKQVTKVDAIPRSATGKLDRRALQLQLER